MPELFVFNKYIAIIIVLIFLLICYYFIKPKSTKKSGTVKKGKKKSGTKGRRPSRHGTKSGRTQKTEKLSEGENEDEEEEDEEEEDNIYKDAEDLYNKVHEGLCQGMSSEEFEELAQDLANASIYIELRQVYNQCKQKGLDPNKSVKIEDYVNIIKAENK